MDLLKALRLLIRESISSGQIPRRPEPSSEMDSIGSVEGFDLAGAPGGILEPIYFYNSLAVSRLIKKGGVLLDLGCGSARFLRCLALLRPDLRLVGVDLSRPMLEKGRELLRVEGLTDRIELRDGDMTQIDKLQLPRLDLISSVFSFHHLPSEVEARRCSRSIETQIGRHGCGLWCFDHLRPRTLRAVHEFPNAFSPGASPIFQNDSRNSVHASFTFDELRSIFKTLIPMGLQSRKAKVFRFYQAHWIRSAGENGSVEINPGFFSPAGRAQGRALQFLMNGLPK